MKKRLTSKKNSSNKFHVLFLLSRVRKKKKKKRMFVNFFFRRKKKNREELRKEETDDFTFNIFFFCLKYKRMFTITEMIVRYFYYDIYWLENRFILRYYFLIMQRNSDGLCKIVNFKMNKFYINIYLNKCYIGDHPIINK